MNYQDKAMMADHTRAGVYFEIRNALHVISLEEVNAIIHQAIKDHESPRQLKNRGRTQR